MNGADFLKSKGISQRRLAKQMGCTLQNVNLWFNGTSSPTVSSIERITAALNTLGADVTYVEVFSALMKSREDKKEAK